MSNQLTSNFDWSKIFVFDNRYQIESFTNSGYVTKNLVAGTVMARYQGGTAIVPFDSTNPNANVPLGVLTDDHEVEAGDTVKVNICTAGDVVANKLTFDNGTDDFNTNVGTAPVQTVKDYLQSNNTGIKLVASTELTSEDNQ